MNDFWEEWARPVDPDEWRGDEWAAFLDVIRDERVERERDRGGWPLPNMKPLPPWGEREEAA